MTGFGHDIPRFVPPGSPGVEADQARQQAASAYNAGRFQEAAQAAQAVLRGGSTDPIMMHVLGASLVRIGRTALGIRALRDAIAQGVNSPEVWCDLANGLRATEDIAGAYDAIDRALALRPAHSPAVRGKVTLLNGEGRYTEAASLIDRALRSAPFDASLALAFAMVARSVSRAGEAIDLLRGMLAGGHVPGVLQRATHAELARLLDAEGRFDEAFEHAQLAAACAGPIPAQDFFDSTIAEWTPARFRAVADSGVSDPLPVLVVGMPRSATSLMEQILASHPSIGGVGESPALPRLEQRARGAGWTRDSLASAATEYLAMLRARAPGKSRVVDKLPGNYTILAPIVKMLPGARIIHCIRDARDTCLSCHFQNFGSGHTYARDLALLGRKYMAYERLMSYWRDTLGIGMMEVRYEELVAGFEPTIRRVLEHVGAEWDPRVLDFHTTARHVRTASAGQVHRPLFSTSIGRWKRYEGHLGPLLAELGPR